jgi:ABC-type uncharacterized transport system substrate-binding protein
MLRCLLPSLPQSNFRSKIVLPLQDLRHTPANDQIGTSIAVEAFRYGLGELGYVEGKNIVLEDRYAEGKFDRLPALAAELVGLKVDVIVTAGPRATRSAKQATVTIPIVMASVNDPVPAVSDQMQFAHEGGLMSYGPDVLDSTRRAAIYVDKILKGAKPGDLPVEQPRKFEFVINLKTAKQIGLTIPPNVLARADRIIK